MEPPLPNPFKNFEEGIEAGLNKGELTVAQRRRFYTTIADAIFMYKSYPKFAELENVARQIVKRWTFLGTKNGESVSI